MESSRTSERHRGFLSTANLLKHRRPSNQTSARQADLRLEQMTLPNRKSVNMATKKSSSKYDEYGRPLVYDRETVITICRKLLIGQDLKTICAKPPMPPGLVFLGWVQDHPEARSIYGSVDNFRMDRGLAKEVGVMPASVSEWEGQVRANCERGWPADWIERKYVPPDWNKVYPLLGGPPVWSSESMEAYNDLINGFTQMLEPRDLMELIWTKEAADATWEAARMAREKNALPERKYQQRLQVIAEHQRRTRGGAVETTVAKAATALDHSRGLEGGFKYYAPLDIAQSRSIKRRENALRQIARWRDGLGAKARTLSDKFIAEQALAERYGVAPFLADADTDDTLGEAMEAAPPLPLAGKAADPVPVPLPGEAAGVAPPPASGNEAAEAALALASGGEAAEVAPPLCASDMAVDAAPPLDPGGAAKEAARQLARAADGAPSDEAAAAAPALVCDREAAPPPTPAGDAADPSPPVPLPVEAVEAAPPLVPTGEDADAAPPDEAAEAAPARAPAGELDIDMDSLTKPINWVGWLTGAEKYTWLALEKGAQKSFKQSSTSKKSLVQNLVVDRKVVRPDQVCPELAHYLPAIAEAAPALPASGEAPQ
jgi:hypothetical protein